jgi:tRNA(adenine34) deaminase
MDKTDARATDERMMRRCFALGMKSAEQGEYPYGAVIARKGEIVAETTNRVAHNHDVTRHAEVVAICEAQKTIGSTSLDDCTMYANVEPCVFCCYAIRESRIARVVYSTRSPIMGGVSRRNILGYRKLSDTMPEIFAPPPELMPDFLSEEADATPHRSSPVAWAFIRAWGLLDAPAQRVPGAARVDLDTEQQFHGIVGALHWLMRGLRKNLFDRFGRGGPS